MNNAFDRVNPFMRILAILYSNAGDLCQFASSGEKNK